MSEYVPLLDRRAQNAAPKLTRSTWCRSCRYSFFPFPAPPLENIYSAAPRSCRKRPHVSKLAQQKTWRKCKTVCKWLKWKIKSKQQQDRKVLKQFMLKNLFWVSRQLRAIGLAACKCRFHASTTSRTLPSPFSFSLSFGTTAISTFGHHSSRLWLTQFH